LSIPVGVAVGVDRETIGEAGRNIQIAITPFDAQRDLGRQKRREGKEKGRKGGSEGGEARK
jgi:hypothetical protein